MATNIFLQHQQTGAIRAPKLGQGKGAVGAGITQDKLGLMTLTVMMTEQMGSLDLSSIADR